MSNTYCLDCHILLSAGNTFESDLCQDCSAERCSECGDRGSNWSVAFSNGMCPSCCNRACPDPKED